MLSFQRIIRHEEDSFALKKRDDGEAAEEKRSSYAVSEVVQQFDGSGEDDGCTPENSITVEEKSVVIVQKRIDMNFVQPRTTRGTRHRLARNNSTVDTTNVLRFLLLSFSLFSCFFRSVLFFFLSSPWILHSIDVLVRLGFLPSSLCFIPVSLK